MKEKLTIIADGGDWEIVRITQMLELIMKKLGIAMPKLGKTEKAVDAELRTREFYKYKYKGRVTLNYLTRSEHLDRIYREQALKCRSKSPVLTTLSRTCDSKSRTHGKKDAIQHRGASQPCPRKQHRSKAACNPGLDT